MTTKKKDKTQPTAKKVERTGTHSFNVRHDDGSIFECQVDDPKKLELMESGNSKSFVMKGSKIKKTPLICDKCKERVYKVTYRDGIYTCTKCI